jgi:hypothetical protein
MSLEYFIDLHHICICFQYTQVNLYVNIYYTPGTRLYEGRAIHWMILLTIVKLLLKSYTDIWSSAHKRKFQFINTKVLIRVVSINEQFYNGSKNH